jgi:predicted SAM-dependent methyltransferase
MCLTRHPLLFGPDYMEIISTHRLGGDYELCATGHASRTGESPWLTGESPWLFTVIAMATHVDPQTGHLKLHLGCGTIVVPGWENIDRSPNVLLSRVPAIKWGLAKAKILTPRHAESSFPREVIHADVLKGLPYPDHSARFIYHAHLIEHMSRWEGLTLLRECARLLAPGGVMRVATPNLADYIQAYNDGESDGADAPTRGDYFMRSLGTFEERRGTVVQRLLRRNFGSTFHQWVYDTESLAHLLREAGFGTTIVRGFRAGEVPNLDQLEVRDYGMFMEASVTIRTASTPADESRQSVEGFAGAGAP